MGGAPLLLCQSPKEGLLGLFAGSMLLLCSFLVGSVFMVKRQDNLTDFRLDVNEAIASVITGGMRNEALGFCCSKAS